MMVAQFQSQVKEWPNRDPLGEPGFEALRNDPDMKNLFFSQAFTTIGGQPNLYTFVANSPLFWADMLGLDLGPVDLWPIIPPKQPKPPWMPPYSIGPVDLNPFKRNPSLTCHFGGRWTGTVSGNPIKGSINGTLSGPILGGTLTISGGNNGGKGGWNAGGSLTWTW